MTEQDRVEQAANGVGPLAGDAAGVGAVGIRAVGVDAAGVDPVGVDAADVEGLVVDRAPEVGRWRLHRGGIVNIWQYREQTFDFSGGRAIFQGTNGSGKSRTLELLLPLCLDGDLRYLGSKGAGTVSIRRLMLDDYDGGPNRIGYAWIELHRTTAKGADEYLTCGIGVKASATSQQISDSWRFVTPSRVGTHFQLASADRVPLGPAALREVIGADRVYDEAAFRAKVAETVYGVPGGRYGDLLHLQRTLRNPDIGLKVQDGQLEQILTDALPPLDAGVVEQLATSFEDLESIRENIGRLGAADTAMSAFLATYSGYALGALHAAGGRAQAATKTLDSAHGEIRKLEQRLVVDAEKHAEAEERVRVLEERDLELENSIDSLKSLPAYQGLRDLQDREKLVERTREAAGAALDNAGVQRNHADRAVETVLTVLRRLGGDIEDAAELALSTSDAVAAAGLDPALCPSVPSAPEPVPGTETGQVRAKPDPEAEPLAIERRTPPPVAPDELSAVLAEAAGRAGDLASVVAQRAALAMSLHDRAMSLDADRQELDKLQAKARDAQIEATESAGWRNEARQRFTVAAEVWREKTTAWITAGPFADDHAARPPRPPAADAVLTGPESTRQARDAARKWAAPHLTGLRQRVAAARQSVDDLIGRVKSAERRLIELRKGVDAAPPGLVEQGPGAPFYRLVDFAGLTDTERAGLEAALQGSGLLTAWVRPDGGIGDAPGAANGIPAASGASGPGTELGGPGSATVAGAAVSRNAVSAPAVGRDQSASSGVSDTAGTAAGILAAGAAVGSATSSAVIGDAADKVAGIPATGAARTSAAARSRGEAAVPAGVVAGILATVAGVAPSSLGGVLVPAVEPGGPVPAEVVAGLLASVSFGEEYDGLAVWADGRWRAGVLRGVGGKPDAEFVGAGAREAARQRAIAELAGALEELHTELAVAESELRERSRTVEGWDRHLDAFPDDRELIGARVTAEQAGRQAADAATKAERRRSEHVAAEGRVRAMETGLAQDAGAAGLTADTEALRHAHRAATQARGSAESLRDALAKRCVGTVRDLVEALHDHNAAVDDRETAERVADDKCVAFHREAAALAELTAAVGGAAEEVARQLGELERSRREARVALPESRRTAGELSNQVVKTQTLLDTRGAEIDGKRSAASAAAQAFAEALAAPGVWPAAVDEDRPADDADAWDLLATAVAESKRLPSEENVLGKLQNLQSSLAGTHNVLPERHAGILTVVVSAEEGPAPVAVAARRVAGRLAERRGFLTEQYQGIFALHLVRELAERLSAQIAVAEDLTRRMNEVLDTARSSQGVHVRLDWQPAAWLDESTLEALRLLRVPFAQRTEEQDARLQQVFTERIESERDSATGGYTEILARALDYRSWFAFTVRVRDTGPDGKPRSRRLRQLSSGETRLISYVTLFAAAAAFYGAISAGLASTMSPLRLVLLDEAFERLDDPTIARMLELLVDLDMDWVITWPSGWGVSDRIPRMHIYDVLRPKSGHGVACTHTTWDGTTLDRDDP
ncbi:SbcC/MukB-like Walker B domain-containing protein [Actinokineospora cianjurensis]|uniref:Nuclease SbcCD subunit C n=1 Tax=Actinokineospora cianjurensis TaxID=585224 RepID=A0A421AY66_9PSEU|nr:SbcC/MukB-like Walker B domain-containing protein [Actinokineospora cianjurensis]RLK54719.1 putative exonuclease SbcCD C subunit [Actinokineospora cianjurensis]